MFFAALLGAAHGMGTIAWGDIRARIARSDPELLRLIEKNFTVDPMGVALKLGPAFGKSAGQSVPPYDFDAVRKSTGDRYNLQIQESDDYEFTGRFRFTWRVLTKKEPKP